MWLEDSSFSLLTLLENPIILSLAALNALLACSLEKPDDGPFCLKCNNEIHRKIDDNRIEDDVTMIS